jgi:hypothetical protein
MNAHAFSSTICSFLFPLLSLSDSFFAAMGRIGAILGNVMFGELESVSAAVPLFITGVSLLLAALTGGLLPETKHLNLA